PPVSPGEPAHDEKARNLRLRAFLFATLLINLRLSGAICTIFTLLPGELAGMITVRITASFPARGENRPLGLKSRRAPPICKE
ncbi:TPA: hypothetical protein ACKQCR_005305, partial [Serratia marcescens]